MIDTLLHLALLVFLPLPLLGVIGRTRSWFAGRIGAPLLQPCHDVWKLLGKGEVLSETTGWIFRAAPALSLASLLAAGLVVPLVSGRSPLAFDGDVLLFAYLLGLSRFLVMTAALDTGSSFEGMGASREAAFSALAEPALLMALAQACLSARSLSFAGVVAALPAADWGPARPETLIVAVVLFVVLLAECSRVPVDDPATHLELTMIHEVMVLDDGGPDLAFILYGSALKLFLFAAILVHLLVPMPLGGGAWNVFAFLAGLVTVAVAVGIVESAMARIRLPRVPQFLVAASAIALVGLLVFRFRGHP